MVNQSRRVLALLKDFEQEKRFVEGFVHVSPDHCHCCTCSMHGSVAQAPRRSVFFDCFRLPFFFCPVTRVRGLLCAHRLLRAPVGTRSARQRHCCGLQKENSSAASKLSAHPRGALACVTCERLVGRPRLHMVHSLSLVRDSRFFVPCRPLFAFAVTTYLTRLTLATATAGGSSSGGLTGRQQPNNLSALPVSTLAQGWLDWFLSGDAATSPFGLDSDARCTFQQTSTGPWFINTNALGNDTRRCTSTHKHTNTQTHKQRNTHTNTHHRISLLTLGSPRWSASSGGPRVQLVRDALSQGPQRAHHIRQ